MNQPLTDDQKLEQQKVVEAHVLAVQASIREVVGNLKARSIVHDLSKFDEPELSGLYRLRKAGEALPYGSPEEAAARETEPEALDHHYRENDHHPEHYRWGVGDMSLMALTEMLADWRDASRRHPGGSLRQSIITNIARYGISEQLAGVLWATAYELNWIERPEPPINQEGTTP